MKDLRRKQIVSIQYYNSPCGEIILASAGDCLCLCDWNKMPCAERNKHRLIRLLNAEYIIAPSAVLINYQKPDGSGITGIAMPITKAAFLVRDAQSIPDIMRQAFAVAASGRPGPVLIDFLKNVTSADQMIDYEFIPWRQNRQCAGIQELNSSHQLKNPEPNQQDVEKLLEMISQAERPLLICGGGVVRGKAEKEFREFAEKLDAPVAITVMGGGGFPGSHPLTTGMIGMHGSQASNVACAECDLLIAVGCRFSDRVALDPKTFAKQAKIVQIDIDRAEIDTTAS